MADGNLNWQSHIKLIENKILKNDEVLFKGSLHFNKKYLSVIFFSFIHSHINCGNTTWASTLQAKLQNILTKQKYVAQTKFHGEKKSHVRPL